MNDDVRPPIAQGLNAQVEQPLYTPAGGDAHPVRALVTALPVGAFTASVLFDVLSLFAENPQQADTDNSRAADLLKVGLGASLAGLALELIDSLDVPAATAAGKAATRRMALDGGVVAVYLLNLAAREKQRAAARTHDGAVDAAPIGLSLVGLALLAAAGKLQLFRRG